MLDFVTAQSTTFAMSVLSGTSFVGAVLDETNFNNTYAPSPACFTRIQAEHAFFMNTRLSRSAFDQAVLVRALFCESDLSDVDFRGADFSQANLQKANMRRCKLDRTRFDKSLLSGANLCEAVLDGAVFVQTPLEPSILQGANVDNCTFSEINRETVEASAVTGDPLYEA